MLKIFILALCLILFSCFKADIVQYEKKNKLAPRDASGLQYGGIGGMTDTSIICNPATLGRKFCRFLENMIIHFGQIQKIIIVTFRTYNF